jgi:hypothetical protein
MKTRAIRQNGDCHQRAEDYHQRRHRRRTTSSPPSGRTGTRSQASFVVPPGAKVCA